MEEHECHECKKPGAKLQTFCQEMLKGLKPEDVIPQRFHHPECWKKHLKVCPYVQPQSH